ncbi:death-on-curing protein [Coxiella burnetii]|uniref:virulence protein RhuM/Fic/DOC family protein n=1 Tax=Coxiella burnetii TaxID=777 RepID=UPI0002FA5F1C|nr:virulence protein RhuM/Fic/DOC family protein [Coxiella burnetii]AML49240.1 death-on-curing protein [Coxiella burnetii]AML55174.1 death-on-curing protein [Coxiella burnetii]ATN69154.1 death-on-curing protein [Coxiella burnetii]ATN71070.1 death-on-curing protein [Coxiella burnetii]ATN72983.1 death-on-curing protein [Coxiella burnetii]
MPMKHKEIPNAVIYQAKSGKIAFRGDLERDTVWGNLQQIADLFGVQKSAISKHLKNLYKGGELEKKATVSILETVQMEGNRRIKRRLEYCNLDAILSVGYRVNSKEATQFRIWATKTLKQHLLQGYTIDKKRIAANYELFMRAVSDVKTLLPKSGEVKTEDVLELIHAFADAWVSLDAYDSENFPKEGATQKQVTFTAEELQKTLHGFKQELIAKMQATELFGKARTKDAIQGIIGNIFQSFGKKDLYSSVEEKAAHLLYFFVKNHPFVDGNKRSGAFAFVWFLRKAGLLRASLTSEALTALTLLVAESDPKDKNRIIGLTLLLLQHS